MLIKKSLHRLFLMLFIVLLGGCAHISATPDTESLRERAQAYWNAKLSGDLVTTWNFEETRVRGQLTLAQYAKSGGMMFTKIVITDVRIDSNGKGIVTMDTEYFVPGLRGKKPLQQTLTDPWKWIDNQWYHELARAIPGGEPAK